MHYIQKELNSSPETNGTQKQRLDKPVPPVTLPVGAHTFAAIDWKESKICLNCHANV